MKKFNFIYGALIACAMTFAACNPNDYPEFDDADAFVAFTSSTLSVDETAGSVDVPMLLTSLAGLEGTATVEVVDSLTTAKEGVHYTIEGSKTLNFTKAEPSRKMTIKVVDNGDFTGDVKLVLNIVGATGVNLGKNVTCTITIVDDEHPLGALLGTYKTVGESNFGGTVEGQVVLEKDEKDINTVWIGNMVPGGTSKYVYGIVNAEKTEIKIPVGQVIATSSSYPLITLEAYGAPDYNAIPTGGNITAYIQEDGSIVINDYYGSCVFDASGAQLGWFELLLGTVWTKQ